jgi:hypothetical protein
MILRTVFALTGITLDHLVASLETRKSHVRNRILFVMGFLCRDNGSKCGQWEMDTREAMMRSAEVPW